MLNNNYYGYPQYQGYNPSYIPSYTPYPQSIPQRAVATTTPAPTQTQQPVVQPQYEAPITDIKFVSADEAKAFLPLPNNRVVLVDITNSVATIKFTDMMGQTTSESFSYQKLAEIPKTNESTEQKIDTSKFLTRDDLKGFITKTDLKGIDSKIDKLEKLINKQSKDEEKNEQKKEGE